MRWFIMLAFLTSCVENEAPFWEPECEGDAVPVCEDWATRCASHILEMCVCGQWEAVHNCAMMDGDCGEWGDNISSCLETSTEGIGQGLATPGTENACYHYWELGTNITATERAGQSIPYLCYHFPNSYCATEYNGGICD